MDVIHQLALEDEDNAQAWKTAQDQLQPLQDQIKHIYGDAQVEFGAVIYAQSDTEVQ